MSGTVFALSVICPCTCNCWLF